MGTPATLPADFFDKKESQSAPDTLPADFFDTPLKEAVSVKVTSGDEEIKQAPLADRLGKAETISAPHGLLEKVRSLYQEYTPDVVQDAILNLTKLGEFAGVSGETPGVGIGATGAVKAAENPIVQGLKRSAQKNYMDVLLPSRKADVPLAERTAATMAEQKVVSGSRESLQRTAQKGMEEWGPEAAKAFEGADSVPLKDVYSAIEELKAKHLYVTGTNVVPRNRAGLEAYLNEAKKDLAELADETGKINPQILDNYIDDINRGLVGANGNYATNLGPKTLKAMQQKLARTIRVVLDTPNTTAAQINAAYSLHANVNKFLESTRRAKITAKSGLMTGSSKGFGALIERNLPKFVREVPRRIFGVFDSVPWNTVAGATKQKIAEALSEGNWDRAWILMRGASIAKSSNPEQEQ